MQAKGVQRQYSHGCYSFKLYDLLAKKGISHNNFMWETDTSYGTMRRYADGSAQKIDLALLDRWCAFLECTMQDIIEYHPKGI